jgi:hypothetical protein
LIGKLTATLMDRAIEIAMQRKLNEKVDRLRRRDNDDHARFRQQCLRWADDNREALAAIQLKLPEGLNDRAFDAWEPLLAIAEIAGGDWPKLAREAAIALSGGDPNTEEKSVELLGHIKVEFSKIEFPAMTTKALIDALCSDKERPWATWNKNEKPITDRQIARLLSEFRMIISETVHPNETGEVKDAKGYKRARFAEAFDRYLTPANEASRAQTGGQQASKRTNADEMGTSSDFCVRPETDQDGSEKCEKPANHAGLDARTDKNPQPPREGNSGNGAGQFRSDVEDAYAELRVRGEAVRDDAPDIPAALWRGEVCTHCGQPVIGEPWDYHGVKVRLHDACQYPWIDAYEAAAARTGVEEEPGKMSEQSEPDGNAYFGLCPVCHKSDGYLNVGREHYFYCAEHKVRWWAGSNLFSSWRYETEGEQRRKYDEVGMAHFANVEPYSPPEAA